MGLFAILFIFGWTQSALANPIVRISGFNDLTLGTWSGTGDLSDEDPVCVYKSTDTSYKISAHGSGSGNAFTLSSAGSTIPYEVYFKGSIGSYVQLTSGAIGTSFTAANMVADDCGGLTNATLKVVATATELAKALTGNYSGTVTILLEPS